MATTTSKKRSAKSQKAGEEKIKSAYKEWILTRGEDPQSVYLFCKHIGIQESDFYEHFSSFQSLMKNIWLDFLHGTITMVKGEKVFGEYSSREKALAFYFTFFEQLKHERSFVSISFPANSLNPMEIAGKFQALKKEFSAFFDEILSQGFKTEEIISRPVISERYKDGLWLQFLFLIRFWIKDDSKGFEKTDAAVEKSVNLAFELMGSSPLDSMIDFGKFLFQNQN